MKLLRRIRIFFFASLITISLSVALIYFGAFPTQVKLTGNLVLLTRSFFHPEALELTDIGSVKMEHTLILAAILSLLPTLLILNLGIKRTFSLVILTAISLIIAAIALINTKKILLPLWEGEIALIIGSLSAVFVKMIFANAQQEFLRLAFSQFVSEEMLHELMKDPEKLRLAGKEVLITVMFVDIRGFTTFSEQNAPTMVVTQLNDLLDKVTHVILDHKGTVNKYMGDGVMAFWGAPNTDKRQAENACKAALAIAHKIETETSFKVGVGLNHGHAIVGNMGSSKRFDYTVIGDTVNTASRLETSTKELKVPIVISESVKDRLKEEKAEFAMEDLGDISVKGKATKIHVYGLTT